MAELNPLLREHKTQRESSGFASKLRQLFERSVSQPTQPPVDKPQNKTVRILYTPGGRQIIVGKDANMEDVIKLSRVYP